MCSLNGYFKVPPVLPVLITILAVPVDFIMGFFENLLIQKQHLKILRP